MQNLKKIAFAGIIALSVCFNAHARPANDQERKELIGLIDTVADSVNKREFGSVIANMPPRFYEEMAKRAMVSTEVMKGRMRDEADKALSQVKQFTYRLDKQNIEYKETPSGSFYALIPTYTEIDGRNSESLSLALYDEGKWYLVSNAMKALSSPLFLEIYPSFKGVEVPAVLPSLEMPG